MGIHHAGTTKASGLESVPLATGQFSHQQAGRLTEIDATCSPTRYFLTAANPAACESETHSPNTCVRVLPSLSGRASNCQPQKRFLQAKPSSCPLACLPLKSRHNTYLELPFGHRGGQQGQTRSPLKLRSIAPAINRNDVAQSVPS